MSAKILDGRLVSDFLLKEVDHEVMRLKAGGISPKLVIILVGKNPASLSYIRQKELASNKTSIDYEQINLDEKTTTEKLISIIEKLNKDKSVHGVLVQLPLPRHINVPLVTRAIDPQKDVDCFQAYNIGKMFLSMEFEHMVPCTPKGIIEMLKFYKISLAGQHIVIVGRSNLVGKPLSMMMLNRDATVTICHSKTKNLAKFTNMADILVVAVGSPRMIKAKMVKRGAVVIDVGTTKVKDKLVGDVDFEKVKAKASWITPVPGGIGPMTVASLMDNVVKAAKRQNIS